MIDQLLKETGSLLLAPLAIIFAALYLTKGAYGLQRSRSQDRKDFLDLWMKADKADDLWLQVAVRHVFGENLPSPLIRHAMVQAQAARALGDLAFAWRLLDMDEASGELRWRKCRHFSRRVRRWEAWAWLFGYIALAALACGCIWLAIVSGGKSVIGVMSWILAVEMGCFAFWSLIRSERLREAHHDVPRWTSTLRWQGGSCDAPERALRARPKPGKRRARA